MLDWTDRHCRYLHRLLSRHALLYSEMVTTGALIHGDWARHLDYNAAELPLALQLGGSEPSDLARCARMAQDWGYSEVNLNCGCPSERVQRGAFGACLMREPALVADGVKAMLDAVSIPVTVKHRIGIDKTESYEFVRDFVGALSLAGCRTFIVHARNAWLQGLSPKDNREIPPLRYEAVYRLKQDFPGLEFVINGGITTLDQARGFLDQGLDGVMLGRAAYHDPANTLIGADALWGDGPGRDAFQVVEAMRPYIAQHLEGGGRLHQITRHMLGLFTGRPGARGWRRVLSEGASRPGAGPDLIDAALAELAPSALGV